MKITNKVLAFALATILLIGGVSVPASASSIVANPTASTVLVSGNYVGQPVTFEAYNINGSNYFKLRDLAYTMSREGKPFDVSWDGAANAISITSGEWYNSIGGEMYGSDGRAKTATPTNSKILLDGVEMSFAAYNIDGNNYFKLRDIAEALDFSVLWNGSRNAIEIDAFIGYVPEDALPALGNPTHEAEGRGNSIGNLSMGGKLAKSGDWVYYTESGDSDKLYKIKTDGTGKAKLSDKTWVESINVIGDWVYYRAHTVVSFFDIHVDVCKIRTDGTDETLILRDEAGDGSFTVIGDWIYYGNLSLNKIKTDGTGKTKLTDDFDSLIYNLIIVDDWAYYTNMSNDYGVYNGIGIGKIKTDGTGRAQLCEDDILQFTISGDWIYYSQCDDKGLSGGGKLYKIRTDGTGKTKVIDEAVYDFNVVGDWIFCEIYENDTTGQSHYVARIRADGTDKAVVSYRASRMAPYIFGNWVYFSSYSDDRVRIDGTH